MKCLSLGLAAAAFAAPVALTLNDPLTATPAAPTAQSGETIRCNGKNVRGDDARPGTLTFAEIQKALDAPGAHESFVPPAPVGFSSELAAKIPKDNPLTRAKVELGRQLYFDPRLSKDLTVSCATCHNPAKGWTDIDATSVGIHGQRGGRSAPTVMNRVLAPVQFWDGRAESLEAQAVGPIGNAIEMGFSVEEAAKRLNGIDGYKVQFEKIFGGPATPERIAKAIASFERTVLTGGAPYDYWLAAEPFRQPDPDETAEDKKRREEILAAEKAHPLTAAANRGRELFFGKAQCSVCHAGENFTDEQYWNLGVGMTAKTIDKGREDFTKKEADRGKYRTMTCRNVKDTGPYMHDGSLKTLRDVVEHYNKGGIDNPWLSKEKIRPLKLTKEEVDDVVAFLEQGLQGTVTSVEVPKLP
jgi:cytochrome c peroxidase